MPPQPSARRRGNSAPFKKAKNPKGVIKKIWYYIKTQKSAMVLISLAVIIQTIAVVYGTTLIGTAIDKYLAVFNFKGLARFSILLGAVYLISAAAAWVQSRLTVIVSNKTMYKIRKDLFEKLQGLSLKYFDSLPHGELMSRLTNDVDNIGQALSQSTVSLISSVLSLFMTFIAMLLISPLLTIVVILIIPAGIFITKTVASHSKKYFAKQQKTLGELNSLIEETISGQKVVKIFGREEKIIDEFAAKNNELKYAGIKAQFLSGIIWPIMNSLSNLGYSLVAFLGSLLLLTGGWGLSVGKISNMLIFSKQFTRPIIEISNLFNTLQSAIASAERVFEVIDETPEPSEGKPVTAVAGKVEFKDVTFGYNRKEPVLKNVSITAEPGDTIALVGPTGAGKTTIVNLLTRFYDVDGGTILIDGNDIRDLNRNTLRQKLGMVLQDTYLFSSSIRENIRYGKLDASDSEVENAAQLANVHQFITCLPKGYDTILSDGGEGISQGQRQLISIARAILSNPSVLILDEATSSIDTRTEKHIQQALLTLMKGRTSFVIAHRLSTIRDANEILVINDGQIIERGNHDFLYLQKGFYYNLYTSQFKRISDEVSA